MNPLNLKADVRLQARLHVADDEAAAGLQSLAHLMARVQSAAAHAHRQGAAPLHTLRTHESDVSPPDSLSLSVTWSCFAHIICCSQSCSVCLVIRLLVSC